MLFDAKYMVCMMNDKQHDNAVSRRSLDFLEVPFIRESSHCFYSRSTTITHSPFSL